MSRKARPLQLEVEAGRYRVTIRGNEWRLIFRQDGDLRHFLDLRSELLARFGVFVHAGA